MPDEARKAGIDEPNRAHSEILGKAHLTTVGRADVAALAKLLGYCYNAPRLVIEDGVIDWFAIPGVKRGGNMRAFALGVLVSVLSLSLPAGAQTFGEFTGRVADTTGAVIAGAKVTITNTATNVARETETNEAGNFTVPFLNPGVYDLQAET